MKIPKTIQELYRLVLVEGVKIESFESSGEINIWTRGTKRLSYLYWAIFCPSESWFIERPFRFRLKDTIGTGTMNPRR